MLLLLMPLGRVLTLPLAGGAIALSGQAANFSLIEPLGSGAFSLFGEPAAFRRTYIFQTSCGSFGLTGEPAGAGFVKPLNLGFFALLGEPAYLFVSYPVPPAATAKFSWHMQGLGVMVSQSAHATFYWKV